MLNSAEKKYHPKPQNLEKVLEQMLNHPELTYGEMAEAAGLTRATFDRVKDSDEFWDEYHRRNYDRFKAIQTDAVTMLRKLVNEGNMQAVKYALDGTQYAPEMTLTVNTPDIHISIDGMEDDDNGEDDTDTEESR